MGCLTYVFGVEVIIKKWLRCNLINYFVLQIIPFLLIPNLEYEDINEKRYEGSYKNSS